MPTIMSSKDQTPEAPPAPCDDCAISAPRSDLLRLPLEVLGIVVRYLSDRSTRKLGEVCHQLREATEARRWRSVRLDPGGYEMFTAKEIGSLRG